MKCFWLITNPASGSARELSADALAALLGQQGASEAGRTAFPAEALPTADALIAAEVDTVVLFAGDGTINTTLCALAGWEGGFLILPGGTMNLLAKVLHGDATPDAIVAAAAAASRRVALPVADAGERRAFVGIILGPAAYWGRARELTRQNALSRLLRAVRFAWARTFGRGVRIAGAPALRARYQAVFVRPAPNELAVTGIDARDLRSIVELGWTWLTGEWLDARAVTHCRSTRLQLNDAKPVPALFDGEAVVLAPGTVIVPAMTAPLFLATKGAA